MPCEIEKAFEKEYGKRKGKSIFYKWESKHKFKFLNPKTMDYCPKCRKRTEHIKHSSMKMCKICAYQERI